MLVLWDQFEGQILPLLFLLLLLLLLLLLGCEHVCWDMSQLPVRGGCRCWWGEWRLDCHLWGGRGSRVL